MNIHKGVNEGVKMCLIYFLEAENAIPRGLHMWHKKRIFSALTWLIFVREMVKWRGNIQISTPPDTVIPMWHFRQWHFRLSPFHPGEGTKSRGEVGATGARGWGTAPLALPICLGHLYRAPISLAEPKPRPWIEHPNHPTSVGYKFYRNMSRLHVA